MKKNGRPTLYKDEYDKQVKKLCKLGATDDEIADFFNVTKQTINGWKSKHPSFFDSLKEGKLEADCKVAAKLYDRALGYSHKEEKIFNNNGTILRAETIKHYPPDTTAMIFWLKNRRPSQWRDVHNIDIKNKTVHRIKKRFDGK